MDERVWRALTERLKTLAAQSQRTAERYGPQPPDRWLDGAEVCQRLRISKRTLQSYRDKRVLPYSNVGGKFFYRENDVAAFLKARRIGKEV